MSAGNALIGSKTKLAPTVHLGEVSASNYAGVVLPCMAPAPGSTVSEEVLGLLAEAVAAGLPIAASRGSNDGLTQDTNRLQSS